MHDGLIFGFMCIFNYRTIIICNINCRESKWKKTIQYCLVTTVLMIKISRRTTRPFMKTFV